MSECKTCGQEKAKCSCKDGFTPAVIEISNPEELILFHKVIIPASLGDESQTPATVGKYCNVLMVYEANGHAYLYSSDGIPSKIAFDSGGVLYVEELPEVAQASVGFLYITKEGTAAITNDNQEWVQISGGSGGTSNFNDLSNRPRYAGERMTGNTNIPEVPDVSNFVTEQEVEQEVTRAVGNEATARVSADNALSSRINSLSSSLSSETADRTAADAALQAAVNDEKSAREAADASLQTEITNATGNLEAEIRQDLAATDAAIQAEQAARIQADAGKVDKVEGKGLSTNDFTNDDKDKLDSAIQPDNINYTVMTDLNLPATASTTSVVLTGDKVNLKEGTTSDKEIPLPVASSTQAGVINSATYQTIQDHTARIDAIEGGVVAITGLSASPSQADLTSAWQTETGLTTLINGAAILDVDNDKKWTYYTNTSTWYSASTTGSVTINPFTNTSAGTILGSNTDGQVHAETDGTGSVQGWDAVKADIANNTSAIATKVDAETGKGLSTNDFTDAFKTKLESIAANAEVNTPIYQTTGTETDGAMSQAATTNALNSKVDKETGKSLSTNDFTDAFKTKLEGVEAGAEPNRPIYTGTGQNTDGSMTQKAVTDALADKADQSTTYTKTETDTAITDAVATATSNKLESANIIAGTGLEKTVSGNDNTLEIDDTVAVISDDTIPSGTILPDVGTNRLVDGAVTNAKLGPEAVKSHNIDFTTLGSLYKNLETGYAISGSAYETKQSLTAIVAGGYVAIANCSAGLGNASASAQTMYLRIRKNNTSNIDAKFATVSPNGFVNLSAVGYVELAVGDTVNLQTQCTTAVVASENNRSSLVLIRIS